MEEIEDMVYCRGAQYVDHDRPVYHKGSAGRSCDMARNLMNE